MLRIHNSLTNRKETFRPIQPGKVRLYVCGMTVYDYCHLGHARAMVVFDMVVRFLRHAGYEVNFVRNITDIDDKIIRRATELGESMASLTARFTQAMHEDADALGCVRPDAEPRATGHMAEIVAMVEALVAGGHAYPAGNGGVYYAVSTFADYGRVSGERLEDLRVGVRVERGEAKRDPADFVLWKAARDGEPSWPSPWGSGRPGWHIECSAMSAACLGHHFDIHGGGLDLKFPHHENEIAQSEAATGETYVNYWMHNGHVRVDDEKMSKSLGNFFTVRDVLARYRAEEVRYFLLSSHYRSPLNYTAEMLEQARGAMQRLYLALRGLAAADVAGGDAEPERYAAAMDDDFNTPLALSVLFDLARDVNRLRETEDPAAAGLAPRLRSLAGVLGLLQQPAEDYLKGAGAVDANDVEIDRLVEARTEARRQRDFARADGIRDELQARGIVLEDSAEGTTWRRG